MTRMVARSSAVPEAHRGRLLGEFVPAFCPTRALPSLRTAPLFARLRGSETKTEKDSVLPSF